MQVCRDWRALALSMPVLWNRMSVILDVQPPASEPTHQALCRLLNQWLSRSGQHPLHISYSIHGRGTLPEFISSTLTQYAHRVEILDLQHDSWALEELLDSLTISLPILRRLSAAVLASHCSLTMRPRSPSLRDLALRIPLDEDASGEIDLQTLTRFSCRGMFVSQVFTILQLATNLEELELHLDIHPFDDAVMPLTLPRLHKLTLVAANDADVLESLTLPRLDLHVFVPSANFAWSAPYLPIFLAFLARSTCRLTRLSPKHSHDEHGPLDVAKFLAPLAAHIVALRYDFPQLLRQHGERIPMAVFLDRLESVCGMGTTLEEVHLRCPGHDKNGFVELPAPIHGRLNGLKRGGMRITVAQYGYKSAESGKEPEQVLFE
ncbi:hypothetical protein DFH08DRAFT_41319 [Mycena albidolilacea]|uniref:F-box domain-containing protein n=1 Tax=Mycena albidolilacea TaxID=1033008 RepID=A0AAD7AB94_9AGAR|nr:hypothetical protein DFH08DRAFT_41319 [Mycena albidolilacea]